jgi:hypothetical protein
LGRRGRVGRKGNSSSGSVLIGTKWRWQRRRSSKDKEDERKKKGRGRKGDMKRGENASEK